MIKTFELYCNNGLEKEILIKKLTNLNYSNNHHVSDEHYYECNKKLEGYVPWGLSQLDYYHQIIIRVFLFMQNDSFNCPTIIENLDKIQEIENEYFPIDKASGDSENDESAYLLTPQ